MDLPPDAFEVAGTGLSRYEAAAHGISGRRRYRPEVAHLSRDRWVIGAPVAAERRVVLLAELTPDSAAISHDTAAWWYGLPADQRRASGRIHVTVPPGGPAPQRRQMTVHVRALPATDVNIHRGLSVTTPERLFIDMSAMSDQERLLILGDAILNRGLATPESIAARVASARRARGVCLARQTVPLLDGRAQSPPESVLRLRLAAARLPPPVPQLAVRLEHMVVHLDLGWEEARVGLEYEGAQHAEWPQFGMDVDRYSDLAAAEWLIVRATRDDLRNGSQRLLARVRKALRERGAAC